MEERSSMAPSEGRIHGKPDSPYLAFWSDNHRNPETLSL
jgi:hypothetical protein